MDAQVIEELKYPKVRLPKSFDVDDSMFVQPPPPEERKELEIVRGPGIGQVPANDPLPEKLSGVAAIKVGDKITTDHIMPAGPRLKHRSNIEKYSTFTFEGVDADFAGRAAKLRDKRVHGFIVAGESYGQGSSREHAAMCPMHLGVKAVLAKSIERIHMANLVNFGIVPMIFGKAGDYDAIETGDSLSVEGVREGLSGDGKLVVKNETKGTEIPVKIEVSARQKEMLLAGGKMNVVRGKV